MNIKRAKNEIKNALKAYLATDEFGAYRIPPIRQRPILLMGPPGIGKTQIMQQIAEETGDLLYHLMAMMICKGITADDLAEELERRSGKTGNLKTFHTSDHTT